MNTTQTVNHPPNSFDSVVESLEKEFEKERGDWRMSYDDMVTRIHDVPNHYLLDKDILWNRMKCIEVMNKRKNQYRNIRTSYKKQEAKHLRDISEENTQFRYSEKERKQIVESAMATQKEVVMLWDDQVKFFQEMIWNIGYLQNAVKRYHEYFMTERKLSYT